VTTTTDPTSRPAPVFDVRCPATNEIVGSYPLHGADHVATVVHAGRLAAKWWKELGYDGRRQRLDAFRGLIARRAAQLAHVVHQEMGKPYSDAHLEIALTLGHIAWAGRNARRVLATQRAKSHPLGANLAGQTSYEPLGVIGVIGPWNYPVFTPMGSIVYALAAGNAVVFKPSEFTPGVGDWLVEAFAQVVPEYPVLQLITGSGSTGAALCRSGVDKIAFTGSTATAKKVMAVCAETLTPLVAECGGKDALLVDADADIEAAAQAAVWGAMSNAGQTCIGVERVYVHDHVFEAFAQRVSAIVGCIRAGTDPAAKIGPITMLAQQQVIEAHLEAALDDGGKIRVSGAGESNGRVVQPVVLVGVPENSRAVTEETFGPVFTMRRVADMDEAVALTNASRYGLGATVFSRVAGRRIAARLRCGMVSVNTVFGFAALPSVPFGGVGDSGFGRIHGPDGLREFCYAHSVVRQRFRSPLALLTFDRSARADALLAKIVTLVHGRRSSMLAVQRSRESKRSNG